ncbi:MAG TPA: YbbR-like domain-containing protein [Planctomycetota bacterium]|nr:YbbR-like domain-containing protein [Planctomycetota bacterium]
MPTMAGFLRFLQSLLFEDWWLKITCIVFSMLMWFYIDGELTDQSDFLVGVRPNDIVLPSGWELAPDQTLPKYWVRLRGARRRFQVFNSDKIMFRKQTITNPQVGRNPIDIEPAEVEIEENFEIVSVTPKDERPSVLLIATTRRVKRVRVKTTGKVNPRFIAEPPVADPDQVNVEGAAEDLDQLEFVWTEDVDITDAEQDVVREVGIQPFVDVGGRRIQLRSNAVVRAIVKVRPQLVTRRMTLDVRPLALSGTALTVEPKSVEVEVQAEEQEFAAPDFASSILLYVEWPRTWETPKSQEMALGPASVQVKAAPPPRVQVRGVDGGPLPTVTVRGALAGPAIK